MNDRRWVNPHQPQTLYIAQILLYLQAGFGLLFALLAGFRVHPVFLLLWIAAIFAANGLANEDRWGYQLAVGVALVPFVLRLVFAAVYGPRTLTADPIGLMFDIALVALVLHPLSRDYQRVWFR